MDPFDGRTVRAAYDLVAEDYAATFGDDLASLPVDRALLEDGVALMPEGHPVLDLGCGPAQVAGHLAAHGAEPIGADLSLGMLAVARRQAACPRLVCADARRLPFPSGRLGGVVAYYSLQHLPRSDLGGALDEVHRALRRDGVLVIALHLGEGEVFVDELLGHRLPTVGGTLIGPDELVDTVVARSFVVHDVRRRQARPHEHPAERIYLTASA